MPGPFVHELRVRYGECDAQGIVFNPNYLAYFDVAVTELYREAVGVWGTLVERGVDVVVAETNLRFRSPARFDDVLALQLTVAEMGTTSLRIDFEFCRDGELLIEGWLRQVFVDATTWAKTPIPDWVREPLSRYGPNGSAGAPP